MNATVPEGPRRGHVMVGWGRALPARPHSTPLVGTDGKHEVGLLEAVLGPPPSCDSRPIYTEENAAPFKMDTGSRPVRPRLCTPARFAQNAAHRAAVQGHCSYEKQSHGGASPSPTTVTETRQEEARGATPPAARGSCVPAGPVAHAHAAARGRAHSPCSAFTPRGTSAS